MSLSTPFVQSLRNDFHSFEDDAHVKVPEAEYSSIHQRPKKRSVCTTRNDGNAPDTILTDSEKFRIETFLPIVDSWAQGLSTRGAAYDSFNGKFSFLININELNNAEIQSKCKDLANFYDTDLDCFDLYLECLQFKDYVDADLSERNRSEKDGIGYILKATILYYSLQLR